MYKKGTTVYKREKDTRKNRINKEHVYYSREDRDEKNELFIQRFKQLFIIVFVIVFALPWLGFTILHVVMNTNLDILPFFGIELTVEFVRILGFTCLEISEGLILTFLMIFAIKGIKRTGLIITMSISSVFVIFGIIMINNGINLQDIVISDTGFFCAGIALIMAMIMFLECIISTKSSK
jgi:hypothetical protein